MSLQKVEMQDFFKLRYDMFCCEYLCKTTTIYYVLYCNTV